MGSVHVVEGVHCLVPNIFGIEHDQKQIYGIGRVGGEVKRNGGGACGCGLTSDVSLIDSELEFPLYPSGKQKLRRRFGES